MPPEYALNDESGCFKILVTQNLFGLSFGCKVAPYCPLNIARIQILEPNFELLPQGSGVCTSCPLAVASQFIEWLSTDLLLDLPLERKISLNAPTCLLCHRDMLSMFPILKTLSLFCFN